MFTSFRPEGAVFVPTLALSTVFTAYQGLFVNWIMDRASISTQAFVLLYVLLILDRSEDLSAGQVILTWII